MAEPIIIVGCGGHGREVLGIIRAINAVSPDTWDVLGFADDAPSEENLKRVARLEVDFLGSLSTLESHSERYVIGVGNPNARESIARRITRYKIEPAVLVHPDATVGELNELGPGVVLFAGARVTTNVKLGKHVHVNQNSTIGHDTVLGDFVSINPLAAVSGECVLETGVLVGTTAAIRQQIRVGAYATIGAGACVVKDVPPHCVVKGVPAR
jgi:sugar O-acyltransferase (sialic acid O-acetyltransferase NeuD family)